MAKYEVEAPDGQLLTVEGPEGAPEEVIQKVAAENYVPVTPDTGFSGAAKSSMEKMKGEGALLLGKLGLMDEDKAEQYYKRKSKYADNIFKPTEKGWDEDPVTKFKELLGSSLPYMAAPLIGAAGVAALPEEIAGAGIGLLGAEIGAPAIGGFLTNATQFTGTNLGRQVDEGSSLKDADLGAAAAAAVPQSILDIATDHMIPGVRSIFKRGGIDLTEKEAGQLAKKELENTVKPTVLQRAAGYGGKALQTAAVEGVNEAGQQVLERMQAGLDLGSPEATKEYLDNFIGGAVLGGAIAVPGHFYEKNVEEPRKQRMEEYQRQSDLKKQQRKEMLAQQQAEYERQVAEAQARGQEPPPPPAPPAPPLLLSAPDPRNHAPSVTNDVLQNPTGNFSTTGRMNTETGQWEVNPLLGDKAEKRVNDIRVNDHGKPALKEFSIEDLARSGYDRGYIGGLLTNRFDYKGEKVTPSQVLKTADSKGIETGTDGFNDFITRVTGQDAPRNQNGQKVSAKEHLNSLTPVERFAVAKALEEAPTNPEEGKTILKEGTNARDWHDADYHDAVNAVNAEIDKHGEQSIPDTIKTIQDATFLGKGLKPQEADAHRLLEEMIRRGDISHNFYTRRDSDPSNPSYYRTVTKGTPAATKPDSLNIVREHLGVGRAARAAYTYTDPSGSKVSFPTLEAAEEHAIRGLNDKTLRSMVKNADKDAKGGQLHPLSKRYAEMAKNELTERKGLGKARGILVSKGEGKVRSELKEGEEKRLAKAGIKTTETQKKEAEAKAAEEEKIRAEEQAKQEAAQKIIEEKRDKLTKELTAALRKFGLEKVALRVVDSIANGGAVGEYADQIISIAMDAEKPMSEMRHEVVHALREMGAFTDSEWQILKNKAKTEWVPRFLRNVRDADGVSMYDRYEEVYEQQNGNLEGFQDYIEEEAIAEAFKYYDKNAKPAGLIGNVFTRINEFLRRLGNAMRGLGFKHSEDIFARIERGELKEGRAKTSGTRYALSEKNVRDRNKVLQKAAQDLQAGNLTREQYEKLVNQNKPITPYTSVPKPATPEQAINALKSDQKDKYGIPSKVLKKGDPVALRLDIPAYFYHNTWVPTVHQQEAGFKAGKVIGYESVAAVTKPTFGLSSEQAGLSIAAGKPKGTIATIKGNWNPITPQEAEKLGKKYLNDPAWSQVGMDPERHSYFYDRKTTEPIVSADEVIQIGPLVLAKNAVYTSKSQFKYSLVNRVEQAKFTEQEIQDLVKRVGTRIAGMKSAETLDDVKNAVAKLQQYTAEGLKGKDWYENSAKAVLDAFNGDPVLAEKFFQIIAITSANTEVAANFTKTLKAWNQFAEGKPIKVGTENENKKVEALLNFGEDWGGRKTNTFYSNLMEAMEGKDSGRSTIDLHMTRMIFDKDAPTDAQYQLAENMVRLLSSKVGLLPRQVQAASWVTQKAKSMFDMYREKGWKKNLSDKELREFAFERAVADYSHQMKERAAKLPITEALKEPSESIKARTQNITGEVIPSTQTAEGQAEELAFKDKERFTKQIANSDTIQNLAKSLGIDSKVRITVGSGAYADKVNPNLIVQVINDNPEQAHKDALDLANSMSYVFKQDATPMFRADPALAQTGQLGYHFKFDAVELTPAQQKKILALVQGKFGTDAGFTKMRGNELVMINYRGEDGKPFLTTDENFMNGIEELRNDLNKISTISSQDVFGAESEYPYHDWKSEPTGTSIVQGIQTSRPNRPDLQRQLDNFRESFVSDLRSTVRAAGKTPRFSLRQVREQNTKYSIALKSLAPDTALTSETHPNPNGDLGFIPAGTPVPQMPIRMLVGTHNDIDNKGFGANHLIKRMMADASRKPPVLTKELLEDTLLQAENLTHSFTRIYQAQRGSLVLYNPLTHDSMVVAPQQDFYSIVTMYNNPRVDFQNGRPIWQGKNVQPLQAGYVQPIKGLNVVAGQQGVIQKPVTATVKKRRVITPEGISRIANSYSLRAADTPEFKRWFGDSKITANGEPKVMYHGTAADITEFKPKQANAIFLTDNPKFAKDFSQLSKHYMEQDAFNSASQEDKIKQLQAVRKLLEEEGRDTDQIMKDIRKLKKGEKLPSDFYISGGYSDLLDYVNRDQSGAENIIPVFVKASNPFDYQNTKHIEQVLNVATPEEMQPIMQRASYNPDRLKRIIGEGSWNTIESPQFQAAVKRAGFDAFYVSEGGNKNLAVYQPNQVKSAFTQKPTESPDIRYSLATPMSRLTTVGQQVSGGKRLQESIKGVYDAWHNEDATTKWRTQFVNPAAGVARTLHDHPTYDANGQLRGDLLRNAFAQVVNVIHNIMQTGLPMLHADGTIGTDLDPDKALARSRVLAKQLDGKIEFNGKPESGMDMVGEVARYKRGEEIMEEDRIYNATHKDKRNREKQVTPQQIAWANQTMAQHPEIQQIFDIWKANNTAVLNLWEKVGLIDKAYADELRAKKFYVSLAMSDENLADLMESTTQFISSGTKTTAKIHALKGSLDVKNIWENVEKQNASMIAAAYQNNVRRVSVAQLTGFGGAIVQNANGKPLKDNEVVKVNGVDMKPNLRFKIDGKIVNAIITNPVDLAAFESMHYEIGPVMKLFSAANKFLRFGALVSPDFWFRQIIKDPIHATMVTNSGIVTPLHSAARFYDILRNRSESAKILAARGVIGQYDSPIDIHQYLNEAGTNSKDANVMQKLYHKLMSIHEASDAATRVAIFDNQKAKALAKGMTEEQATDYAVMKARESINFNIHGNSKLLNAARHMVPFLSASINSLDTLYRAITGKGIGAEERQEAIRLFKQRAMMMAAFSLAYAVLMSGDDDYNKVADDIKDANFLIKNPAGEGFIKIPAPFEVGYLFKTLPEGLVRYMAGTSTGKEVLNSYWHGFMQNIPSNGIPVPQLAKPVLETVTNHSFFTGNTIESIGDARLPVEDRGRNASETAKILSKMGLGAVSLSPAKIDNLMSGYFAQYGTFFMALSDNVAYAAEGKSPPSTDFARQPIIKSFLTDPTRDKAVGDFYDLLKNANETAQEFTELKAQGKAEEIKAFSEDKEKMLQNAAAPNLRRIAKNMTDIRKMINFIQEDQTKSPQERREIINKLTEQYNRVAELGVRAASSYGLPR